MGNEQSKTPVFLEMVDGELHVHPHEGQEKVLDSKRQIIAMLCGKQSGKTEFSAYWMKISGFGNFMVRQKNTRRARKRGSGCVGGVSELPPTRRKDATNVL